jgi:hypothetical protein
VNGLDPSSSTWHAIQSYLNARLVELREANEAFISETKTLEIRAEIKAIKNLLALPEEAATWVPPQPDSYEPHSSLM